jgi:FeS assembly SUF system regulator
MVPSIPQARRNRVFRLSKITDYGIVLLAHLASTDEPPVHNARLLADEVDLPFPVVGKILKSLARRGVLHSHRGAKGGYSLSRPAHEITVAEVIAALEGPVALTECSGSSTCVHEEHCRVRDPWQVINRVVQNALSEITLADLVGSDISSARPLDRFLHVEDTARRLIRDLPTQ